MQCKEVVANMKSYFLPPPLPLWRVLLNQSLDKAFLLGWAGSPPQGRLLNSRLCWTIFYLPHLHLGSSKKMEYPYQACHSFWPSLQKKFKLLAILHSIEIIISLGGTATPILVLAFVMARIISSHPTALVHERWNPEYVEDSLLNQGISIEGHRGSSTSKDHIFPQTATNTRCQHPAGIKVFRGSTHCLVQYFFTTSNLGILFWK